MTAHTHDAPQTGASTTRAAHVYDSTCPDASLTVRDVRLYTDGRASVVVSGHPDTQRGDRVIAALRGPRSRQHYEIERVKPGLDGDVTLDLRSRGVTFAQMVHDDRQRDAGLNHWAELDQPAL